MEHENDPDIDEPYVPTPVANVMGGAADQSTSVPTIEELTHGTELFVRLQSPSRFLLKTR